MRRYTLARGLSQLRNTALTASISCSFGSLGKSLPIFSLYRALNFTTRAFMSSASRSTSFVTPLASFISSMIFSKSDLLISMTTSENICTKRR